MDTNKKMRNGIFTMNDEHTQSENQILGSHTNILESLINLSVSVIILLFSVKSKLSSSYNRVLRVNISSLLVWILINISKPDIPKNCISVVQTGVMLC